MSVFDASLVISTFRPSGIDIVLAGIRDQSYKKFETILVDRRYELRHDRVMKLAKEYGIQNFVHVPEFRRNGPWINFCSAWNTGFALAKGEIVIICQDWAYCPSGYIEAHLNAVDGKKRYVLSPYVYTQLPSIRLPYGFDPVAQMSRGNYCVEPDDIISGKILDEISCFEQGLFDPAWLRNLPRLNRPDQDPRFHPRGHLEAKNWVHVKNESILRSVLWELNGLDERLERGKGPMDTDWSNRLESAGIELWWEPSGLQFVPNPRFLIRTMPWGDMETRVHGRWSYRDGEVYCERRVNEMKSGSPPVALNSYTLSGLSEYLEKWRGGNIDPPVLDVDDRAYYGIDLWPDSKFWPDPK